MLSPQERLLASIPGIIRHASFSLAAEKKNRLFLSRCTSCFFEDQTKHQTSAIASTAIVE